MAFTVTSAVNAGTATTSPTVNYPASVAAGATCVVAALGHLEERAPADFIAAVPDLITALNDPDATVRRQAAQAHADEFARREQMKVLVRPFGSF